MWIWGPDSVEPGRDQSPPDSLLVVLACLALAWFLLAGVRAFDDESTWRYPVPREVVETLTDRP